MKSKKQIASVSNDLVLNSRYKLTATEQKLILYMASLIKPEDTELNSQLVPFKEIERLFNQNNTKWGNIYAYLNEVLGALTKKTITFNSDVKIKGVHLKGHISWVAAAVPQYDKEGKLCIEFEFSKYMKPFFIELKRNFTKYQIQDIINMSSPNSIRLYQILKTHKDKQSKYRDVAVVSYSIEDLKILMDLNDTKAYKQYGNFKNRVLKTAQQQLQENTHIRFEFKEKKTGRKVTELVFSIYNNLPNAEEELINLFNMEEINGQGQKGLIDSIFEIVKDWGINRDGVKKICKSHDEKYIKEKINYTKKMAKLGKIKSSKASFLFGALKDDYKDDDLQKKQKNNVKKVTQQLIDNSKENEQKKHQECMNALRKELLIKHPNALEKAFEETPKLYGFKTERTNMENYESSPIYKAGVHNTLLETYPNFFKKELERHKKFIQKIKK